MTGHAKCACLKTMKGSVRAPLIEVADKQEALPSVRGSGALFNKAIKVAIRAISDWPTAILFLSRNGRLYIYINVGGVHIRSHEFFFRVSRSIEICVYYILSRLPNLLCFDVLIKYSELIVKVL